MKNNNKELALSRFAYVDGQYVPHASAAVHIEDRGYQFADAAYEVVAIMGGRILDFDPHMDRMERSLASLEIPVPMARMAFRAAMEELLRLNRLQNGIIYYQVSRGVAPRGHGFPEQVLAPVVVMTVKRMDFDAIRRKQAKGIKIITVPETRWARPDIKSVSLLANVLAKEEASRAGAAEAWFVDDDGLVTEGSSTNAWIVDADGNLRTRALDGAILPGITRQSLDKVVQGLGLPVKEEAFSVEEAEHAREVMMTSTTNFVMPVVQVNDSVIGDGVPGPLAQMLLASYWQYVDEAGLS